MHRFLTFIKSSEYEDLQEAKLSGSGLQGLRHANKYVIPGTSLVTHSSHKDIASGDSVQVLGHRVDNKGSVHARVLHNDVEKTIPTSKLVKPAVGSRVFKYNDEHATTKMWNHANKDKSHKNLNKLHADIEAAKHDPKHPLSFEQSDSDGFEGKNKHENSKEDYYKKLHKASHSIVAMANSNDAVIQKHLKKGSTAYVQGSETGRLSSTYRKHYGERVKGAAGTSKADIRLGEKHESGAGFISVKDETGGQISSGGSKEFKAVHDTAATNMLNNHPKYKHLSDEEKSKHHAKIMDHVTKISNIMDDDSKEQHTNEQLKARMHAASEIHDKMHTEYPHLYHHVRHEAMTGHGKFEPNPDGSASSNSATHIIRHAKLGKNNSVLKPAEVTNIDDIDHGSKAKGIFAKGKSGIGNKLSYRIMGLG